MKKVNTRVSKRMVAVMVAAVATMSLCVGCGNSAKVEDAAPSNEVQEAAAVESTAVADNELVTYEFETFDNVKVVLDASNIIVQEPSDDPENSDLISAEAAGNIIAPGRDFVYLEDASNYYVADISRNLVTVATKGDAQGAADDAALDENPGAFETDSWSISYDTEKWYGFMDENGTTIINNLNAVAGSSYIEISEADVATASDAVAMLEETKGKKLTAPEKAEMAGNECYVAYDAEGNTGEGVYIFDFYIIYEHNGKVIIVDESITHDDDASRAEALSYEFDDVVNTMVLK